MFWKCSKQSRVIDFKNYGKGFYYTTKDPVYIDWIKTYCKGNTVSEAFAELCSMEGYPSSIQTYDNQEVTLGTGYGAHGLLPLVQKQVPSLILSINPTNIAIMKTKKWAAKWVVSAETKYKLAVTSAMLNTFATSTAKLQINTTDKFVYEFIAHLYWWYSGPLLGKTYSLNNDAENAIKALKDFKAGLEKYRIKVPSNQLRLYVERLKNKTGIDILFLL